jgi:hypothetical protein
MSALWTLTRREIVDRRPLLWGTLVAVLLPIVARLQPWLSPELRRAWGEGLALIFGITFPIALAIGLGASVIGEDLAQRRLGFYFSRPLSAFSIWASKNLAAILITLGTMAAFVLPVALLSDTRPSTVLGDLMRKFPDWLLPWMAGLVCLIFVAEAVAGAYRARDGLFGLDIAALATLVYLGAALVWRLYPSAFETLLLMELPTIVLVAVAAAVAGALQVIVGRTDSRRGHLALSSSLWGTLAAGLLAAAGFSAWALSLTPGEAGVPPSGVRANPSGSRVAFIARRLRAGYRPMFLLDTTTGQFDRLPWYRMFQGFAFSKDGRRAAWLEDGDVTTLVLRRLDSAGSPTTRSTLRGYSGFPHLARLSDDGREALVVIGAKVAIVDTDSGREAASTSLDKLDMYSQNPYRHSRWAFVGNTVVGFFAPLSLSGLPLVISTFDFRTGRVEAGPRVEGADQVRAVRDGRALVTGHSGLLAIADRSGIQRLLPGESGAVVTSAFLLEDGRAAALVEKSGERRLMIWKGDNLAVDVPSPESALYIAGEPRVGWVALGADFFKPSKTFFVEASLGRVVRVEEGVTPAVGQVIRGWSEDEALPAGSPGARLFVGRQGELVRIDPENGRREAVLVPPVAGDDQ